MPSYCPFLSSPARVIDKKTTIPAVDTPCRGSQCPLYRPHGQFCAITEVPDIVDQVAALGTSIGEQNDDHRRSLDRMGTDIRKILGNWTGENKAIIGELRSANDQILTDNREQLEGLLGMLGQVSNLNSRLDHVVDTLQRALDRIEEKRRVREAYEATREAIDLYRKGDYSPAISVLVKARGVLGEMSDLLSTLGCVYLAMGRYDDAISELRHSIHRDPQSAEAHVNLGAALLLTQQVEEAEEALREGLRLNPNSGPGWNTLGNLLFSAGHRIKGVEAWHRAVACNPDLEPAWENLRRQQSADNVPFEDLRAEILTG